MDARHFRIIFPLFALVFLGAAPGCASMGSWEDILRDAGGGVYGNEIRGEVQYVDTRRREISVSNGWGSAERVRYDGRTEVLYHQRRYDVRDLERGDYVRVRVDDDRGREPYARTINVEESRYDDRSRSDRDRDGAFRLSRVNGRVQDVDTRRGTFVVEISRRERVYVTVPDRVDRQVRDRFRRLRRGDQVVVEGDRIRSDQLILYRFR